MQKTRPKTSFWDNLLPHPFVSVLVALSWLMLAHSVSAGNLLMALVLALLIPKLIQPFIARTPDINWTAAIRLFFVVVWDIMICNIRVAKLVLGPTDRMQPNGSVSLSKHNTNRSTVFWR